MMVRIKISISKEMLTVPLPVGVPLKVSPGGRLSLIGCNPLLPRRAVGVTQGNRV